MTTVAGAFTLVELLVVVTIIVVLLALIAPAIDKAVYEAELAVCASQLKSVTKGASMYAMGNQRRYPPNRRIEENDAQAQPVDLAGVFVLWEDPGQRPPIKEFIDIDVLVDPLCRKVDLDTQREGTPLHLIMASYNMWWGWKYTGHDKMAKLGDSFTWTGPTNPAANTMPQRTARFQWVISDRQHLKRGSETQSSHPDKDGVLQALAMQDEKNNPWVPQAFTITMSLWRALTDNHGLLDMNYAHADGSVVRIRDQVPYDERTFPTPERAGNVNPGQHFLFIPER